MMQFTQGLHRAVQLYPNDIATVFEGCERTFTELQNRVSRLAGALQSLGVKRGDCVTLLSLNSDKYIESYLAIAWVGAVVNPANFRWSADEVSYSINDSQSRFLLIDNNFSGITSALREKCDQLTHTIFTEGVPGHACDIENVYCYEALIEESEGIPDVAAGGDDTFGVFYTGGTTGVPKGVVLSHMNVCSSALALMAEGCFPDGAIGLHLAPMFHLADMMMTTSLILRGGRHVICRNFKPDMALAEINKHRVSDLLLVPAMLQALIAELGSSSVNTSSIKRIVYGASPASETLLSKTLEMIPSAALTQVYGMTEMSAVMTVLPPKMHLQEARSAGMLRSGGRSACHVQVKIVDNNNTELQRTQVGEIVAKGPNVMKGYLNKPEATASAIVNGWMHTGDVGYMNEDGYVFIVDRMKDMIISGGENIYCAEVENIVSTFPGVVSCAVIGIPCDKLGEKVHVILVVEAGAVVELDELYEHCKKSIAGYKCPRSMEIIDALPLSGAGKVLKTELRKSYWEAENSAVN